MDSVITNYFFIFYKVLKQATLPPMLKWILDPVWHTLGVELMHCREDSIHERRQKRYKTGVRERVVSAGCVPFHVPQALMLQVFQKISW